LKSSCSLVLYFLLFGVSMVVPPFTCVLGHLKMYKMSCKTI
jgi:hypothetical protein